MIGRWEATDDVRTEVTAESADHMAAVLVNGNLLLPDDLHLRSY